jgi:hypothetical protein
MATFWARSKKGKEKKRKMRKYMTITTGTNSWEEPT